MSRTCLFFIALLGACSASPLQSRVGASNNQYVPTGFPTEWMPLEGLGAANESSNNNNLVLPLNISGAQTGNLLLPLDPGSDPDYGHRIKFVPGRSSPGGQLIATLMHHAYEYWKSPNDAPITRYVDTRDDVFGNFEHFLWPVNPPSARLTPTLVGVMYCWMMRESLNAQSWPGEIITHIYNLRVLIGTMKVLNTQGSIAAPAASPNSTHISSCPECAVQTSSQPNVTSDGSLALTDTATALAEKAWLDCAQGMLFIAFKNPWITLVSDTLAKSRTVILGYVSTIDPTIQVNLTVNWLGVSHRTLFTWDLVVQNLIKLVDTAARNNEWQYRERQQYRIGGQVGLEIYIGRRYQPATGASGNEGTAAA